MKQFKVYRNGPKPYLVLTVTLNKSAIEMTGNNNLVKSLLTHVINPTDDAKTNYQALLAHFENASAYRVVH